MSSAATQRTALEIINQGDEQLTLKDSGEITEEEALEQLNQLIQEALSLGYEDAVKELDLIRIQIAPSVV